MKGDISDNLDLATLKKVDVLAILILPANDGVGCHPKLLELRSHQQEDIWDHVMAKVALPQELNGFLNLSLRFMANQPVIGLRGHGETEHFIKRARLE